MKRRTEITIEIDRVMVIRQNKNRSSWCEACGRESSMVTAGEAADMLQARESVIYRLAETGQLHFATTADGLLLICPDSLQALLEDESTPPTNTQLICRNAGPLAD